MTTYVDPIIRDLYPKDPCEVSTPRQSGVTEMFSANRIAPWYAQGRPLDTLMGDPKVTILDEAPALNTKKDLDAVLRLAGLDWTVSKRPLKVARDLAPILEDEDPLLDGWANFDVSTDEFFAIVRDDTEKVLGIVGKGYEVVQNRQGLDIVQAILDTGDVTVETAGVLWEGKRVWVLVNIPRELTIEGDIHFPYLMFTNSNDGSGSLREDITAERACCKNTIQWAIAEAPCSWTHRHSRNVIANSKDAKNVLGLADRYFDAFEADVKDLMAVKVTLAEFDAMVKEEFPISPEDTERVRRNQTEKRDLVRTMYESDTDGGLHKGNGYGVVNAFNSFDLWAAPIRNEERRAERTMKALTTGALSARTTSIRDRVMSLA